MLGIDSKILSLPAKLLLYVELYDLSIDDDCIEGYSLHHVMMISVDIAHSDIYVDRCLGMMGSNVDEYK